MGEPTIWRPLALAALLCILVVAVGVCVIRDRRQRARDRVGNPDTDGALAGADLRSQAARDRVDRLLNLPPELVRRDFTAQRYQRDALDAQQRARPLSRVVIQKPRREILALRVFDFAPPPSPSRKGPDAT